MHLKVPLRAGSFVFCLPLSLRLAVCAEEHILKDWRICYRHAMRIFASNSTKWKLHFVQMTDTFHICLLSGWPNDLTIFIPSRDHILSVKSSLFFYIFLSLRHLTGATYAWIISYNQCLNLQLCHLQDMLCNNHNMCAVIIGLTELGQVFI